jgi:hypothetical protein
MSSSIWTQCAGDSRVAPLSLAAWRAVEAQHLVSTRKLVDSTDEQEMLESMIERVKPPAITHGRLHYLLSTPFRYPPLRNGSRFGTRRERGIWYGAMDRRTAFAEVAYYRMVFLEGTRARLGTVETPLTVFSAQLRTRRGIDLTTPPFDALRRTISSPTSYVSSQALGRSMRAANVEVFRYYSARDSEDGVNVGVLSPAAFGSAKPKRFETWHCAATRERVDFAQRDYFKRETFAFPREQFLVNRELPAPAL